MVLFSACASQCKGSSALQGWTSQVLCGQAATRLACRQHSHEQASQQPSKKFQPAHASSAHLQVNPILLQQVGGLQGAAGRAAGRASCRQAPRATLDGSRGGEQHELLLHCLGHTPWTPSKASTHKHQKPAPTSARICSSTARPTAPGPTRPTAIGTVSIARFRAPAIHSLRIRGGCCGAGCCCVVWEGSARATGCSRAGARARRRWGEQAAASGPRDAPVRNPGHLQPESLSLAARSARCKAQPGPSKLGARGCRSPVLKRCL